MNEEVTPGIRALDPNLSPRRIAEDPIVLDSCLLRKSLLVRGLADAALACGSYTAEGYQDDSAKKSVKIYSKDTEVE